MEKLIYILEDDATRMEAFNREFEGHEIVHHETAKGFTDALDNETRKIDLMLLDHDLGGMIYVSQEDKNTGSEVVRWMATTERKLNIEKIVVHSHNHMAGKWMAYDLANVGYTAWTCPFCYLPHGQMVEEFL